MKTIRIYRREVLERTGYRKHPFKSVIQYVLVDGNTGRTAKNCSADYDDPKLRKPFILVLKTRSQKKLDAFIAGLGRTDSDKWLKEELAK